MTDIQPNHGEAGIDERPLLSHQVSIDENFDEHADDPNSALGGASPAGLSHEASSFQTECTSKDAVVNLVNTSIGAGMMALPLAFAKLGVGLGALALFLCGWLTSFSLVGLVKASVRAKRLASYADLVKYRFGSRGSLALQIAILVNNFGSLIIYLIILMDVLVGTGPEYGGLLAMISPDCGKVWYLSRPFVVLLVCIFILAPLLALKNMAALSKTSALSVAAASFFALSTVLLTLRALATGQALGTRNLLPSEEELGSSPLKIFLGVVSTVPIMVTSFMCHFNLHSVMAELRKFSERKMKRICRISISVTGFIYLLVGAGACLVFGTTTKEDVLENFSVEVLAKLLGNSVGAATALSFAVRLAYAVSLLLTFPLIFYPLRSILVEMTLKKNFLDLPDRDFYAVSYSVLAVVFVAATKLPGIWIALELSGSTASVLIAFILPALLVMKMEKAAGRNKPHITALCVTLAALGVLAGVVGVSSVVADLKRMHNMANGGGEGGNTGNPGGVLGASATQAMQDFWRIGNGLHVWMFK